MAELITFVELGFRHIASPAAMDHVLFLVALVAVYQWRDWVALLWVVSAFTVGHSITLALAVTALVRLPTPWVEFLIPVTIVATAVENLLVRDAGAAPGLGRHRPIFAGVFGLVHGAGFANYLKSLFVDSVAVPLLGFNVGIELGQIVVLCGIAMFFAASDRLLTRARLPACAPTPLRLRAVVVSALVALVGARWAVARAPW
jgi:hypothetical protein